MRMNFQLFVNSFSEELLGTQKQKQAGQKVGQDEVRQHLCQDARQGK